MTKRIFRSICLVALVVLVSSLTLTMGVLYSFYSQNQLELLHSQTALVSQAAAHEGMDYFSGLDVPNCRITWIAADGHVLYDSISASAGMENHLEREEIREALATGHGESRRYSATLMEHSIYCAQRLPDGTVLRLSVSQDTVLTLIVDMLPPVLILTAVVVAAAMILAYHLSKRIVRPINALNLDDPLSNRDYEEISPLLRRLASQQRQLRRKHEEFDTVTENMAEGIVLLNGKGIILSINAAAARLLDMTGDCLGKDILLQSHSIQIHNLVYRALKGERSEKTISLPEGNYLVNANPVQSDGRISGAVLLLLDATEKQKAEWMRQEFTANVSHELKTPLHSISGYAELMKSGIVQPQDLPKFYENIYNEAQRLIRLVEDILRLSRLDEGVEDTKWEVVDLYRLAQETVHAYSGPAKLANVTMTLEGDPTHIRAIPHLISGILSNLCDNAIKYNRSGGSVHLTVGSDGDIPFLRVADTGIGIPAEHQERIFERFYRVDKSHSKDVGGTGLGLSIVKHAALILGAKLHLSSTPGQGTTITVRFSK